MPPIRQISTSTSPTTRPTRLRTTRLDNIRTGLHGWFSGRSSIGRIKQRTPESPKTPQLALGLQGLPSTRLHIPYLSLSNSRHSTNASRHSATLQSPMRSPTTPISSLPITLNTLRQQTQQELSTVEPRPTRQNTRGIFTGVSPSEQLLDDLRGPTRLPSRRHRHKQEARCFSRIKNRKIRRNVLICCISGLFLALVLTIYLALALTNRDESEEFHILLILIILVTTIFFCHGLIRLCMMLVHPPTDGDLEAQSLPGMTGPGGFANPVEPIRVALARDEEAAGIENDATKVPPPAYGLWRESVRMDPDRIFWQRNATAMAFPDTEERPATANRPPSYISEDGVDYVVEAAPRSIAPITDVPLASQLPINGVPRLGVRS